MSFPTCKFFKSEQGCKFGNKCRYKHSEQSSPIIFRTSFDHRNQNDVPLRGNYYQRGVPKPPGTSCHSYSTHNENPVNFQQSVDSTSALYSCHQQSSSQNEGPVKTSTFRAFDTDSYIKELDKQPTLCNDEGSLKFQPADHQQPSKQICHYYARHGSCGFGSRCRFAHAPQFSTGPRFTEAAASETEGSRGDIQLAGSVSESEKTNTFTHSQAVQVNQCGPKVSDSLSEGCLLTADGSHTAEGGQRNEVGKLPNNKKPLIRPDRICQYYLQGRCYKGARRCRFLHPRQKKVHSVAETVPVTEIDDAGNKVNNQDDESSTAAACKGTIKGNDKSIVDQNDKGSLGSNKSTTVTHKQRAPCVPQGIKRYRREEIDDVEGSRLRRNEIDQLLKRFPKNKVKVTRDCAEYFKSIVDFSPTDPDWPFDVKLFQLQIDIPSDYPLEMLSISLPVEQDLPETVRRYLEVSIEEWLEEKDRELRDKGQAELVFRTFLRWLDRNVEDIVTEGLRQLKRELVAKASGLEFISAKQLQKQYPGQSASSPEDDEKENDEEADNDEDDEETSSGSDYDEESSSDYDQDSGEEGNEANGQKEKATDNEKNTRKTRLDRIKDMLVEPERRGTEVNLKSLQLRESAAMMYFDKVCLVIQCERCKGSSEFTTSGGRVNVVQCGQCSQTQMCTFRPAMVHQFSPVMGYLDLEACLPFDIVLQNCSTVVSCLNCSKETRPGSLAPGTPLDHWCRACHHKLKICTDGVRFTQLEPSTTLQSLRGVVKVVVPNRKKIPKDPAIQEGKSLPNFGTCKHYKKSYRWLRFPCCGKVYPCDICHDSKEDHEMKFANRMICGFCCKEQVYAAERPCKGCDMNMTRVFTKHWEGGAGCRDKITMCRNDKAKHRNMSKTMSKHSQKVKDMQSKKKTKLRHS